MLKTVFFNLASNYSIDEGFAEDLYLEIEKKYSHKKRHYHDLSHLNNMLNQLLEIKDKINHWDTILFSLFYHDIIYNTLKSNNEEESALFAATEMKLIGVQDEIISNTKLQILATKNHQQNFDDDTNYFLDADLSILGEHEEQYQAYYKNVRKEYSIYPDLIYKAGRKKVLKHFLEMDRIFKTVYFYEKFEKKARENLKMEYILIDLKH